jgi:hypothetical protein
MGIVMKLKKQRLDMEQQAIKDRIELYTQNILMLCVCLFLCFFAIYVVIDAGPEYRERLMSNIIDCAELVTSKIIHLIDFLTTQK